MSVYAIFELSADNMGDFLARDEKVVAFAGTSHRDWIVVRSKNRAAVKRLQDRLCYYDDDGTNEVEVLDTLQEAEAAIDDYSMGAFLGLR